MMSDISLPLSEQQRMFRSRKLLTFLLLFAIVMFFAGLTSAYVVSSSSATFWVRLRIPEAFLWSTAFIAVSSVLAQRALHVVRVGRTALAPWLLGATLLLGGAFTFSQYRGWQALYTKGNALVGKISHTTGDYGTDYTIVYKTGVEPGVRLVLEEGKYYTPDDLKLERPLNEALAEQKNTSSSYFYVLTLVHWLHLLGGMLALVVMTWKTVRGRYSASSHEGLWAGVLYWHFLGGLWVYLLLFLNWIH
jgi:cytochrome c oxidase subunit III